MITVNSYFCGAGLMDAGLTRAGIKIGQAFELDKDACTTYRANFGDHLEQCDLTQKLVLEQDTCDGMVFTYPCTKYSSAGEMHGTRLGDDLFLHALRHLAVARPEFYVVENVPGMAAFPLVMEAMSKMPDYYVQIFAPVEATTWLPQRRSRLIIVGTKRSFNMRPPEATRPVTLAEIIEDDPRVTYHKSIAKRMNGEYRDRPIISDPAKGDVAPCAVAHYSKDRSTRLVVDRRYKLGVRPYSVREYARLQGLPDTFHFPVTDNAAMKQIGNGVPEPIGFWVGTELTRYMKQEKLAA
ncbi:DNA cytosine methyltransferase [Parendozoicomonas haliclonae]|uniref:DNA (cytosine-5-)-methyltransferase n=1 Tax=Parendozoicomonas haliclonae TaxID=1960125 RepID=A0A1X7AGJ9_9GAMM|nr:DNA cytosine methyltransferase [Parendozoicomonas haliclonae]SMA33194.1 Modification methylase HaeIII [Parendozoicomonas haliclonae]